MFLSIFKKNGDLPVMTNRPLVALSLVSPVRRCFVLHWYDL